MALITEFEPLPLDRLRDIAHRMKDEGWRFIQTHAVNCGETVDLYYSFMKDGRVVNYRVENVTAADAVPSITDIFLAAFVFENEARELFGVDMRNIVLDFQGALYAPAESEPMRFISPEQKAAIEKARKAAALKAAKQKHADVKAAASDALQGAWKLSEEKRAKLEKKLAAMDPAKAEKVRAALAAKEAGAEKKPDSVKETQTASGVQKASASIDSKVQKAFSIIDSEVAAKLAHMDPEKARKVREALSRSSSAKGGE